MTVRIRAEVIAVDGRRLVFKVEAWDEAEKIGEGEHERFIINREKFAGRMAQKAHPQQ
jgi:predicted thioesterase